MSSRYEIHPVYAVYIYIYYGTPRNISIGGKNYLKDLSGMHALGLELSLYVTICLFTNKLM